MQFTDRFISVPTKIYNTAMKELTGNEVYEDSFSKINPLEICEYYISSDDDIEVTQVYLKNGRSFCTYITFDEFEKLLNSWQKTNQ